MVVPEAEFALGADHPGRDVPIGLACRHGQRPLGRRQDAARKDHRDEVTDLEVVGAAHDPLRFAGAIGLPDIEGAPIDRLAVLLGLGLLGEHPAHHEGAGDPATVQALLLEPDPDQVGSDLDAGGIRGNGDVLTQPVDRNAHQISIPNCALKRTSPSIMSRMSETPVRNIRARSMPMPKANPE